MRGHPFITSSSIYVSFGLHIWLDTPATTPYTIHRAVSIRSEILELYI